MTLARQSSSRSRSSGAPALNTSALLVAGEVGDFQERIRRQVDDQEADPGVEQALRRSGRVVARGELHVVDRERLVEKLPGGIVVGHREPGPGDEIVGGGDVEDRDGVARVGLPDDADLDGERIGVGGPGDPDERHSQDERGRETARDPEAAVGLGGLPPPPSFGRPPSPALTRRGGNRRRRFPPPCSDSKTGEGDHAKHGGGGCRRRNLKIAA